LKNSICNKDFKQILRNSKSLHIRDLLFYYDYSGQGISFIINRKKGIAVERNLFRRRMRSLFLIYIKKDVGQIQLIIKPLKNLNNNYSWQELRLSFQTFFSKLNK